MNWIQTAIETSQTLGQMLLAAGIAGRISVLRRDLTVREARSVRRFDNMVWVGLILTALSHGPDAFVGHSSLVAILLDPAEWSAAILFAILIGLQIPVQMTLRSWSRYLALEQVPWFTDPEHDRLVRTGKFQLVACLALPLAFALSHSGHSLNP
ncbi:MAG: DUF2214 family protein [Fibrobacteria bacterium]|nr:DUF2214 family protein [Fibrobacteria bacterium]